MFGLSLPKLLILGLIVAIIWYGYKWMARADRLRNSRPRGRKSAGRDSEDLVLCALCGTYGPKSLDHCPEGRDDCPMVRG